MIENQTQLIKILKDVTSNYNQKIEELTSLNNSALILHKKELKNLRKDLSTITTLDLTIIEDILKEAKVEENESKEITRYLKSIKCLLKLNEEKQTTFEISDSQYLYIEMLFKIIDRLTKKHTKIKSQNTKSLKHLTKMFNKYKRLLSELEKEENKNYIMNTHLLKLLFDEYELDEETKRAILLDIMKYNQKLYTKNT